MSAPLLDYTKAIELIKKASSVGVVVHVRPDGDCFGSGVALCAALRSMGKKADLYSDDPVPSRLAFLTEGYLTQGEGFGSQELLIAVDCGDLGRVGSFGSVFAKHKNTLQLDHHLTNDRFAKVNYVCDYASNCEQIYELLVQMGLSLTKEIALPLYVGVISDTGNFMNGNTDEHSFSTAAALRAVTGDNSEVVRTLFRENARERFLLLGLALKNARFYFDGKLCIITVRAEDFQKSGASTDQTEGFVDYAVNVTGTEIGICMMESGKNTFRVSLRSRQGYDVSEVATYFGGGGHIQAAGCTVCGFYEDVVDRVVRQIGFLF